MLLEDTEVKIAIKIPLEVDKETARILDGQSMISNWLYNHLLEIANESRIIYIDTQDKEVGQKLYGMYGLRNLVPGLKEEHPFLKTVYSSVSKNVALRLTKAVNDHQKGKKGERANETGWPNFRSFSKKWFSLLYEEPWTGYNLVKNTLYLSLGKTQIVTKKGETKNKQLKIHMNLKESLPHNFKRSQVIGLRIKKEGNIYYAIFTVKKIVPCTQQGERVIALDPNHKNLSYGVDSAGTATEIQNPWFLKQLDKIIDTLKSKRDNCKKKSVLITREDGSTTYRPSRRWSMFSNLLQETYRVRREQTKVYLYTIANKLFSQYDIVTIGDYTPRGGGINRGMRRSMNNQSLIGRFKKTLEWVAMRSGKTYLEWDERGSTRTCNNCGHKVTEGINPSIREWVCKGCNTSHIRDENAALNGLKRVMTKLELPCSGRLEVLSRRAWRFNGLGI